MTTRPFAIAGETETAPLAKVDSGAEVCLFSREAGAQLGHDVESG